MFIDTHSHLYDERLSRDEAQIQRALDAGVQQMFMPNCDSGTIAPMLAMADAYPDHCFPMMGLHPTYVKENYREELALVAQWLDQRKFWAVGEVGLDYYWDKTWIPQQKDAFSYQVQLARQLSLPVIIHSRESTADCIQIIRAHQDGGLTGIFHCYSGTLEEAREILDLGFYLGIGGVLTYKKSGLDEIVKQLPLSGMVLETDAPYLAPVPHRGKRNESAYIPYIAQHLATLLDLPLHEIAAVTTQNAEKIFKLTQ